MFPFRFSKIACSSIVKKAPALLYAKDDLFRPIFEAGWKIDNSKNEKALIKSFTFVDFAEAFHFMQRIAYSAESLDHHPEWCNVYNKVDISLTTHESKGITEKDLELAGSIEKIYDNIK